MEPVVIDGHTRLCGVIGNPVEHTSSPAIHNTLAQIYGHNLVYVPFKVEDGFIKDAISGAFALNILGLNVTVPYKTDVLECITCIDDMAKRIGAVNTLVRVEDGYKGYNTDILGLKRALLHDGMDLKDKCVVILGAGGAARSAAHIASLMGAKQIYILNRSISKAQVLADEVNKYSDHGLAIALELNQFDRIEADSYVVLQATSVGLAPNENEVIIDNPAFYEKAEYGFDLVYRPAKTKFMKLMEEHGKRTQNGLSMLLYQGIIAYELWNNISVTEEVAAQVYSVLEGTV